jgi:hypothetical protein
MFCFPLQNWITMRGSSTITSISQSEMAYLDLRGFEDIVAWLDVKEVTLGGATHIQINYQTGPSKDETLFTSMTSSAVTLTAGTQTVTKLTMSGANVALSRWLRWQLVVSGTATSTWDAVFRVWIAANVGPHPLRPKTQAGPVRQSGKSCTGDCSKGGSTPVAPQPSGNGRTATYMAPSTAVSGGTRMQPQGPSAMVPGGGPTRGMMPTRFGFGAGPNPYSNPR